MNSINQNQEEKNQENLNTSSAVEKIKELVSIAKTCFLSTQPSSTESYGTRPMTTQEVDEEGSILFLIANDSHVYQDITTNPEVKLHFQGSTHSDFLYLEGKGSFSTDKEKIKQLWNPIMKTWFTEGVDDPRIVILKFRPQDGYYWDNKHGNYIAGIKIMIGAVIGKTMDDSIEGNLRV